MKYTVLLLLSLMLLAGCSAPAVLNPDSNETAVADTAAGNDTVNTDSEITAGSVNDAVNPHPGL